MRYVGFDMSKKEKHEVVGVELDEAKGDHGGTVGSYAYFKCKPGHGVLVPAIDVAKAKPKGNDASKSAGE